jgi:hypothetical protein
MFRLKQPPQTSFCGGAEEYAFAKTAAIAGNFAAFSSARGLALDSINVEKLSCHGARMLQTLKISPFKSFKPFNRFTTFKTLAD